MTIGGQGTGEVERMSAMQVTPSFFRLSGPIRYRGQVFTEKEAEVGHDKKVVLSYGLWQRLFGAEDDAIGKGPAHQWQFVHHRWRHARMACGSSIPMCSSGRRSRSPPKKAPTNSGTAITGSRWDGSAGHAGAGPDTDRCHQRRQPRSTSRS